ncbi:MAG TPA: STAS domain-containing protein [Rhodocyclaceae bacterium]
MSPAATVRRIALDGELTVQSAAATRERLLAALAGSDVLELDLGGVAEFDSAGLQLLLAARKSAQAAGKRMRLFRPPAAVVEVLEFLALGEAFDCVEEDEA